MLISHLLKTGWTARAGWLCVILALLVVANPELRALLLLADAIGLEVLLFLCFTQIRAGLPWVPFALDVLGLGVAPVGRVAGQLIRAMTVLILPSQVMRGAAAQVARLGLVSARALVR
jgi:hypothetical protein